MKHLNRYNSFLIKENFTDIDYIKELIEDHFIDRIDSVKSTHNFNITNVLSISYYVDPKDINDSRITMQSKSEVGMMPVYHYKLILNQSMPQQEIRSIRLKIKSDKQFKLISFNAQSGFKMLGDEIQESTSFNISFVYLEDKPLDHPLIINKLTPVLDKLKYDISDEEIGSLYVFRKQTSYKLDSGDAKLSSNEIKDKIIKLYKDDLETDFNSIKKVIPNLPNHEITAPATKEKVIRISLNTEKGDIIWSINIIAIKATKRPNFDSPFGYEIGVTSVINYYKPYKTQSDQQRQQQGEEDPDDYFW